MVTSISFAMPRFLLFFLLPLLLSASSASAQLQPTLNATLDGYEYPFPVKILPLKLEGQSLRMAYMDVPATAKANGRTRGVAARQELLRSLLARNH